MPPATKQPPRRTPEAEQDGSGSLRALQQARADEEAAPKAPALVGRTEARLFPEPLRPLNRKTTRGFELIDFARDVVGMPFDPWQEWLAIHALELNPDNTYRFRTILVLVARQNGKTHFSRVFTLWRMFLDGARSVLGAAQDVSLAREVYQHCIEMIRSTPCLAEHMGKESRRNGDEYFKLTTGTKYGITASNRSAGRGKSIDQLNLDELREQRKWDGWSALSKTTMAQMHGIILAITNAGDDESVVLNHLREAALSGQDATIGLFEWSAPDACALDDEEAWAMANPGLGYRISMQAIRSAMGTDPPGVFRTEVLCQRVENLDNAINGGAWRDCADASGSLESVRDRVVLCFDVATDNNHATLAGAAMLDDGRVRVELIEAWDGLAPALAELPEILEQMRPAAFSWFPSGPAAAAAAELRKNKDGSITLPRDGSRKVHKISMLELKGGEVAEACMGFAELVFGRKVLHPGDPLLDAHVAGSSKLQSGDTWRFVRKGGAGHVDAAYAAAGASHTARTFVPAKPMPKPKVV